MKLNNVCSYNIKRLLNLNAAVGLFIIKIKVIIDFLLYIYKKFWIWFTLKVTL